MATEKKEEIICKYVGWTNKRVKERLLIVNPLRKETFWLWLLYNYKDEENNLDELYDYLCKTCEPDLDD